MKLRSVDLVRKALQNLPAGLDATYDRMLLSINTEFQQAVISMLKWLCFSETPLTVSALAEVFVLPPPKEAIILADLKQRRLFEPQDVLAYLGSFVVLAWAPGRYIGDDRDVSDEDDCDEDYSDEDYSGKDDGAKGESAEESIEGAGVDDESVEGEGVEDDRAEHDRAEYGSNRNLVYLAHFSIKEYLTSQRIACGSAAVFSFSERDARIHITHSSLRYVADVTSTEEVLNNGFVRYLNPLSWIAMEEWIVHFESLPTEVWSSEVLDAIKHVFAPRSPSLFRTANLLLRSLYYGDDTDLLKWQPLRVSSSLGLRQLTDLLVSATEYLTQEDLDAALQDAAYAGHGDVVELLLDRGAHVEGETTPFCNALHRAALGSRLEVVKLLIDRGADINSRDRSRGAPKLVLQYAAEDRNFDMVKYLVENGAVICDEQEGVCCVSSAAKVGSVEIISFLLDHATGSGCTHSTALHELLGRDVMYNEQVPSALPVLLNRGADINAWGGDNLGYPLHQACTGGDDMLDHINLLLEKGASVGTLGGTLGSTLHAACTARDSSVVIKLLLDQEVDVNAQGGKYANALQAACANSFLDVEVLRVLLDHGADVNASGGEYGNALQAAAGRLYPEIYPWRRPSSSIEFLTLLLQRGADVNQQGGRYGTALQAAASACNKACVQFLLEHGAEVNAKGGEYGTAFQAACAPHTARTPGSTQGEPTAYALKRGIMDTVRLLLDHGADIHIQGGRFGSAWHAAVRACPPGSDWKDLMELLLDCGVDINDARGEPSHTPTALHAALYTLEEWGSFERIDFLLAHGADPALSAGTYGTLLQTGCAAFDEDSEFAIRESRVKQLLEKCPYLDVNERGGLFGCALQAAASSGQTNTVRLLIHKKADVNLRGGKYHTALNAAIVKGYWDIVEVLLEAGAEPDCWSLDEPDEEWLARVREEDGRGAVERYRKVWEKQVGRGMKS